MKKIFLSVFLTLFLSGHVYALAPKRPDTSTPDVQAYPTRSIALDEFNHSEFTLPDGVTKVDMGVYLPELVLTEVVQATTKFRVKEGISPSDDQEAPPERFVLRGGLTSFEANNFVNQIRFGYKPGAGDIGNGVLHGIEGKLTYNIGSLDINFHIIDTWRKEVVAVGKGSGITGGGSLNVDLDFSKSEDGSDVGFDFIFKSAMAPAFRAAVRNAIKQMANDPRTNFIMDWESTVRLVNPGIGVLFLNTGMRDDVVKGNVFSVYDSNDMHIGEIKVTDSQHDQSVAKFKVDPTKSLLNSTKPGDKIKIYYLQK